MTKSDLYPGLDAKLDAILQRNIAEGIAKPSEDVAVSGLETVVQEKLRQAPEAIPEEIRQWAFSRLTSASESWAKHRVSLENLPSPGEITSSPNFGEVAGRLHMTQEMLTGSNLKTPEGLNIGETMKLVLVPWQDFRSQIGKGHFQEWVKQFRKTQGIDNEDYFNEDLIVAIEMNKPMYRNPNQPGQLLTPQIYLDNKIDEDGAWGIMLVQTSEQAGLESILGKSPDDLTSEGVAHYQIADTMGSGETCSVDALGIFEWLALSFQEDPKTLSATSDYSWMLANSLDVGGATYVPVGCWDNDQVKSGLIEADSGIVDVRPRLAVL